MNNRQLLEQTENIALETGDYLRKEQVNLKVADIKEKRDIKIKADRWADNHIRKCLAPIGFPIYSEEGDDSWDRKGRYWVVDPLDGSYNYHSGIPFYSVSIALWEEANPLLGVVYHIQNDEVFSSLKSEGLFYNRKPVRRVKALESFDVLCTGIPVGMSLNEATLNGMIENMKKYKKIRMMGAASLMLAYVAMGRASAYTEKGIMFWDVAAGIALCQEAGLNVNISYVDKLKMDILVTS